MSTESQSPPHDVRIAYHSDGSATVNDVRVTVEPGQNVRDAAYQAAVGLVVAAGASGPVAAKSVEADGTEYPLTLYPLKAVAAANALVNGAGATNDKSAGGSGAADGAGKSGAAGRISGVRRPGAAGRSGGANRSDAADISGGANRSHAAGISGGASRSGAAGTGGAVGAVIGSAGGLEGQYRRARRAWYRPTLSMNWLVAGACACMMLSVLATVLLQENDPSLVHLQVDTENEVGHSGAARALGRAMASLPTIASKPTAKPTASKHRPTSPASTRATASTKTSAVGDVAGPGSDDGLGAGVVSGSDGVSQTSTSSGAPKSAPTPKPRSAPNPGSTQVINLTLALVGGDRTDLTIVYVLTVSTNSTSPITLTYTYAGKGGRATVRKSVVLSGSTEYVLTNVLPAQPYCGGMVTMTVSTSPAAKNGTAVATTQPGC